MFLKPRFLAKFAAIEGALNRPGGTKMLLSALRAIAVIAAMVCGTILLLIYKFLFLLIAAIGLATAYFATASERALERESRA
jgi:hypothetical protein